MKLCGHTMGTPGLDLFASIALFRSLGLEGIEVRCADNGHLNPETADPVLLCHLAAAAHEAGVPIVCLTPYYRDYSTPEAAAAALDGMHLTCRAAEMLDCSLVRATGGQWPLPGRDRQDVWEHTVRGLQAAADIAIQHGVRLALENHSGTLTQTAADTVAMVRQVARPNFGILMDHYWVVAAGQEDPLEAVRLQAPYVLHCHCKGLVRRPDGQPQAGFLDEGEIDWAPVLAVLREHGYGGYLSDEYEKFWRPELPEPEIGMRRNAEYLRRLLG